MHQATHVNDIRPFDLLCVVMNYNYGLQCLQLNVKYKHSHATGLFYTAHRGDLIKQRTILIFISI
jgi:hypothetical protein